MTPSAWSGWRPLVLRPPLSLSRLMYEPGSPTAIYRTPETPVTGGNFITLDAKELLVRLLSVSV